MDELRGRTLGPYELGELIGRGGMGDVYHAYHARLDRHCAIKILRPQLAADPELRERFIREARAAARLDHPNIVTVYDAGEADGVAYFAMQFVAGEPLARLNRSGSLSVDSAVAIVHDIAAALDAAHEIGLVHRDVNPANIIVSLDGSAKLTDFGIVHLQPDAQLTLTGQLLGTPAYMSPEQIAGGEITPQTDIYQLAVVAYELLTRELPFYATEPAGLLVAHLHEAPVPADERVGTLPPAVTATLNRALHKLPEERHLTALDFAESLQSALAGNKAVPLAPPARPRLPSSRFDATTRLDEPGGFASRILTRRNGLVFAVTTVALIIGVAVWVMAREGSGGSEVTPTLLSVAADTATTAPTNAAADLALVGPNTDPAPQRSEDLIHSYDMFEIWPPELEGAVQFEDENSGSGVRLEAEGVTVRKHSLGAEFTDGSAYLEATLNSRPDPYGEVCLLARFDVTTISGYALCFSSEAETFAYYFNESLDPTMSLDLLPPAQRAGMNLPWEWNALEMRFRGDQIWFLVNDTLLGAVTHAAPAGAEVGGSAYRDGTTPHEILWGPLATFGIEPE